VIKIQVDNIEQVKDQYFDQIKGFILKRVNFYLMAFRIIDKQAGVSIDDIVKLGGMHISTKKAYLKLLVKNPKAFRKKDNISRLVLKNSILPHFYVNRAGYIALLEELSIEVTLKKLILAEVDDMLTLKRYYSRTWFNIETVKLLKTIFSYEDFADKKTVPFNAYHLSSLLNVNVCVYCNRIYTNTVIGSGNSCIIRPTFDHFFSQSSAPILALSFYNLIPSCTFCNSNLKGAKEVNLVDHLHPYLEGFGNDAQFDYIQVAYHQDRSDPRNYFIYIRKNLNTTHPKYKRVFGDGKDDVGNVELFKLEEVYKSHADVVGELVVKMDKLSSIHSDNIVKMVASIGASRQDFYRYYFSNYPEAKDFIKRPLAKLTNDIVAKYCPLVLE